MDKRESLTEMSRQGSQVVRADAWDDKYFITSVDQTEANYPSPDEWKRLFNNEWTETVVTLNKETVMARRVL